MHAKTARTNTDLPAAPDVLDVVIVGAGLSGINAAFRLQQHRPHTSYAILEGRESMGGTWDLFRYPGIRSDSDIFTFGFGFKPWKGKATLADGGEILDYIKATAHEFGIDEKIQYGAKVLTANWSTADQAWKLGVERTTSTGTVREVLAARFIVLCSGYYRYDTGYTPEFAGTDDFAGQIVHPQFWPEDLDYADKKVVVIGSGATAVTLIPAMAATAGHVTMLQRSPTWIAPLPSRDRFVQRAKATLPPSAAHTVIRMRNIVQRIALYSFCMRRPERARELLLGAVTKYVGDEQLVADHFTPSYAPWQQRVCASPNGDLFKAITSGSASVVTDHIDSFVPEGIRLKSGDVLEADIIVTATGLQLVPAGGIKITVDGVPFDLADSFIWRGTMVSGLPNASLIVGYTNAAWTLKADLTAQLTCRILSYMDRAGVTAVTPAAPDADVEALPVLGLASGYVQRSIGEFPKQGSKGRWVMHQNYFLDRISVLCARFDRELISGS